MSWLRIPSPINIVDTSKIDGPKYLYIENYVKKNVSGGGSSIRGERDYPILKKTQPDFAWSSCSSGVECPSPWLAGAQRRGPEEPPSCHAGKW